MNIAYFLQPKSQVAYLYDDFTVRQGLEKMKEHGYTAIPIVTRKNEYVGVISEGDFLWYLMKAFVKNEEAETIEIEKVKIRDVPWKNTIEPIHIDTDVEELLQRALNQNFVPAVDDRGVFIGIITRKDIIQHFIDKAKDK